MYSGILSSAIQPSRMACRIIEMQCICPYAPRFLPNAQPRPSERTMSGRSLKYFSANVRSDGIFLSRKCMFAWSCNDCLMNTNDTTPHRSNTPSSEPCGLSSKYLPDDVC